MEVTFEARKKEIRRNPFVHILHYDHSNDAYAVVFFAHSRVAQHLLRRIRDCCFAAPQCCTNIHTFT